LSHHFGGGESDHSAGPLTEANLVADPKHNDVVNRLAKMMEGGWKAARPGESR